MALDLWGKSHRSTAQRRAKRERELLIKVAGLLNSALDATELLEKVCQIVVQAFEVDHSGILLFNESGEWGKLYAEYPPLIHSREATPFGPTIPVRGVKLEEKLFFEQEIVEIYEVATEQSLGSVRTLLLDLGIRSILIVPIVFAGRTLASFSLDAIRRKRHFSAEEKAMCLTLAGQAAVMLHNAHVYQDADVGRHTLDALFRASSQLLALQDPGEILQQAVDLSREATGAWRAVAMILDEGGYIRRLAQTDSIQPNQALALRELAAARTVLDSGKPIFLEDVLLPGDEPSCNQDVRGNCPAACLPLSRMGGILGLLWIQYNKPVTSSESQRHALQIYAHFVTAAYDNARRSQLLGLLQQAAEELSQTQQEEDVLACVAYWSQRVLDGQMSVIWPYDEACEEFIPHLMAAKNVQSKWLTWLQGHPPRAGRLTRRILESETGYIEEPDLEMMTPGKLSSKTMEFLKAHQVRAMQGITLRAGIVQLGVLFVDYVNPRQFSDEEKGLLEYFAQHAARTIQKSRTVERLSSSWHVSRQLTSQSVAGDLETMLQDAIDLARKQLNGNLATLYTYNEEQDSFERLKWSGDPVPNTMTLPGEISKELEKSSLRRLLALTGEISKSTELVEDDPVLASNFTQMNKVISCIGLLLRVSDHRLGVMIVHYQNRHRFSLEEIQIAEHIARQTAIAIHHTQLWEASERKTRRLQVLYKNSVARLLSPQGTLEKIAADALEVLGENCYLAGCFSHITCIDPETGKLYFAAANRPEILKELRMKIGMVDLSFGKPVSIAGRALINRSAQRVGNVKIDRDYIPFREYIHSQLSVPLVVENDVVGVLSVEHPLTNAFSAEDEQNLQDLSMPAAEAIRIIEANEQLESLQRAARQAKTLALIGAAGRLWSHDFGNPYVEDIEQYLQIIERSLRADPLDGDRNTAMQGHIQAIRRRLERLKNPQFLPPRAEEEGARKLSINELLKHRLAWIWENMVDNPDFKGWRPQFVLDKRDPLVLCGQEWLERVIDNLVDNAVKAMQSCAQPGLKIYTELVGDFRKDYVVIRFEDNGRGFPESQLNPGMSDPAQMKAAEKPHLGLSIIQLIVEAYEGSIKLHNSVRGGACVEIRLPAVGWIEEEGQSA
jgi:GAF domain-containing protein